jgi:hypothetical protein
VNLKHCEEVLGLFNSCPSLQLVTFIKMKQQYLEIWRKARFDVQVLNLK